MSALAQGIIAQPKVSYLYPFGSTQPENIEIMRNDSFADRQTNLGDNRRGPMFICYDQEPLNFAYNKPFFDYIVLRNNYISIYFYCLLYLLLLSLLSYLLSIVDIESQIRYNNY